MNSLEIGVLKACRPDKEIPKAKHVDALISAITRNGDFSFVGPLTRCYRDRNYKVVVKALCVTHRLARDGSPVLLKHLERHFRELAVPRVFRDPEHPHATQLIHVYSDYIATKVIVYSKLGRSTERVTPAQAREWATRDSPSASLRTLPLLQRQLDKLLCISPRDALTNMGTRLPPLMVHLLTMIHLDAVRLFAHTTYLQAMHLARARSLTALQATILLQCLDNAPGLSRRFETWCNELYNVNIPVDTVPPAARPDATALAALRARVEAHEDDDAEAAAAEPDGGADPAADEAMLITARSVGDNKPTLNVVSSATANRLQQQQIQQQQQQQQQRRFDNVDRDRESAHPQTNARPAAAASAAGPGAGSSNGRRTSTTGQTYDFGDFAEDNQSGKPTAVAAAAKPAPAAAKAAAAPAAALAVDNDDPFAAFAADFDALSINDTTGNANNNNSSGHSAGASGHGNVSSSAANSNHNAVAGASSSGHNATASGSVSVEVDLFSLLADSAPPANNNNNNNNAGFMNINDGFNAPAQNNNNAGAANGNGNNLWFDPFAFAAAPTTPPSNPPPASMTPAGVPPPYSPAPHAHQEGRPAVGNGNNNGKFGFYDVEPAFALQNNGQQQQQQQQPKQQQQPVNTDDDPFSAFF